MIRDKMTPYFALVFFYMCWRKIKGVSTNSMRKQTRSTYRVHICIYLYLKALKMIQCCIISWYFCIIFLVPLSDLTFFFRTLYFFIHVKLSYAFFMCIYIDILFFHVNVGWYTFSFFFRPRGQVGWSWNSVACSAMWLIFDHLFLLITTVSPSVTNSHLFLWDLHFDTLCDSLWGAGGAKGTFSVQEAW